MPSYPARRGPQLVPTKEATCRRCGCTGLGWVQSKAGKWYLAATYVVDGQLLANPMGFHKCEEFREQMERAGLPYIKG